MAKTVYILRGPSGAGKSTYIQNYLPNGCTVVSADQFFLKGDENGDTYYDFNPALLGQAHARCQWSFVQALQFDIEHVVVDNTNIHKWEYDAYVAIAELAGYKVEIIAFRPETIKDIKTCIERNVHRVPADIVARMCIEFEPDEDAQFVIDID